MKLIYKEIVNFTEEERDYIQGVINILDGLMDISTPSGYNYNMAYTCMQFLANLLFDDRYIAVNSDQKEE